MRVRRIARLQVRQFALGGGELLRQVIERNLNFLRFVGYLLLYGGSLTATLACVPASVVERLALGSGCELLQLRFSCVCAEALPTTSTANEMQRDCQGAPAMKSPFTFFSC